ncbi:DUF4198 domain-containing protein [Calycomorphotria hydatis]|uniref:DUF4198 domain-containing protein n=1 Tax=Calycomorphotria hydatis TaxID=2528027 RepID=UPI0011A84213|nr:DUF4198 domain-containing protein [Calycomorphotria hydatis]
MLLLITSILIGCSGGEDFAVVPASGRVTLDGEPLADVTIRFHPRSGDEGINAGPFSYGKTDEQGSFKLQEARKDGRYGAVPGEHLITFAAVPAEGTNPVEGGDGVYVLPVPEKYRQGINYTIPEEGTEKIQIELNSDN